MWLAPWQRRGVGAISTAATAALGCIFSFRADRTILTAPARGHVFGTVSVRFAPFRLWSVFEAPRAAEKSDKMASGENGWRPSRPQSAPSLSSPRPLRSPPPLLADATWRGVAYRGPSRPTRGGEGGALWKSAVCDGEGGKADARRLRCSLVQVKNQKPMQPGSARSNTARHWPKGPTRSACIPGGPTRPDLTARGGPRGAGGEGARRACDPNAEPRSLAELHGARHIATYVKETTAECSLVQPASDGRKANPAPSTSPHSKKPQGHNASTTAKYPR